jgi:hypothetical protein
MMMSSVWPGASSVDQPKSRSAPSFQKTIVPSESAMTTASASERTS